MIHSNILQKNNLKFIRLIALSLTVFGVDRLTKFFAVKNLAINGLIFNNYLSFVLTFNRGISWGIGNSWEASASFLLQFLTCFVIATFINYTISRYKNGFGIMPEILVLIGALSNLLDRLIYGAVVDFVLLSWDNFSWPVFNLADVAIVCGISFIFCRIFFSDNQ